MSLSAAFPMHLDTRYIEPAISTREEPARWLFIHNFRSSAILYSPFAHLHPVHIRHGLIIQYNHPLPAFSALALFVLFCYTHEILPNHIHAPRLLSCSNSFSLQTRLEICIVYLFVFWTFVITYNTIYAKRPHNDLI